MDDVLFAREADAKNAYVRAAQNHEMLWAEKAKNRWLKEGDKNSKFFHLSIKMRWARNMIRSLKKEDGTVVSGQVHLSQYVADFYEFFHKSVSLQSHPDIFDSIATVLLEEEHLAMEFVLSNEEIKQAVWDLDADSFPSPDSFSGVFYRKCWDIVEEDFCSDVCSFFVSGYFPKGVNNCLISLIPKVEGASSLDKYRPNCMGNFLCKDITKVMASRLSKLLPKLVSEEQGPF
ncbi:uncharacterized protein LOC122089726 [Macadamia integrifolia]|uniref:uncharacterized protein LOC122089726 n=1 Tax=Macadamia integrifolia TaxID=60698 RepID=UPI001C4F7AE5|nr:uncharacterized protein LOC122089726 [Macadamia integrifolia]